MTTQRMSSRLASRLWEFACGSLEGIDAEARVPEADGMPGVNPSPVGELTRSRDDQYLAAVSRPWIRPASFQSVAA